MKLVSRTRENNGKFDITVRDSKGTIIICVEVFTWSMSDYTKEKYKKFFKEQVLERVSDIDDRARINAEIDAFKF